MELGLKDKVAIVTGGSRGIGRAIAETLADEGMLVIVCARSKEILEEICLSRTERMRFLTVDLRKPESHSALIEYANSEFGRIDALVNNAGATARGEFLDLTNDQWKDGFDLKFGAAVGCARAAWPHLAKTKGTIVNIVGIGGRTGSADFAIGGAVNSALLNFTKSLSSRGERDEIRVNAVNPGFIKTERLQTRIQNLAQQRGISELESEEIMRQENGIMGFGQPDDIASLVAFLVSLKSKYIRGAIIDADGGCTRTL